MKIKNAVVGTKVVHKVDGSKGVIAKDAEYECFVLVDWDDGASGFCYLFNLKKAEKVK